MGDVDIGASSDCNLGRNLEAQPQATGFESQQIKPEEFLRRRPRSRPTLNLNQPFFEHASQGNGRDRCLFLSWGPT